MVAQVTSFGRSGVANWLVQRISALVLLAYMVFVVWALLCGEISYSSWSALFDNTWVQAFTMAALVAVVVHAWIGLWSVSTDYFTTRMMGSRGTACRLVFQLLYTVMLFGYLVWGSKIIWG